MAVEYIWYDNLIYGEKAGKHKRRLKHKLEKGKEGINIFLLTLPDGDNNLLDIYRSIEFKQKAYDGIKKYVVGVASGKEEATDMVVQLVDEMYRATGTLDVRKYLDFGLKD